MRYIQFQIEDFNRTASRKALTVTFRSKGKVREIKLNRAVALVACRDGITRLAEVGDQLNLTGMPVINFGGKVFTATKFRKDGKRVVIPAAIDRLADFVAKNPGFRGAFILGKSFVLFTQESLVPGSINYDPFLLADIAAGYPGNRLYDELYAATAVVHFDFPTMMTANEMDAGIYYAGEQFKKLGIRYLDEIPADFHLTADVLKKVFADKAFMDRWMTKK